jgi:RND superfamily putative drug exporter
VTAGQITSAAAIMVGIFGAFALGRDVGLQQFGVGLGIAVFIDATVIRSVLLPVTMKLLGDWNWYLPEWLQWLPQATPDEGASMEAPPVIKLGEDSGVSGPVPASVPVYYN